MATPTDLPESNEQMRDAFTIAEMGRGSAHLLTSDPAKRATVLKFREALHRQQECTAALLNGRWSQDEHGSLYDRAKDVSTAFFDAFAYMDEE